MSENTAHKDRATEHKKIQPRGERPPGVIGEMQPEKILKLLRRMREEHTLEEDERIWEQFEPSLRDSNASFPDEKNGET